MFGIFPFGVSYFAEGPVASTSTGTLIVSTINVDRSILWTLHSVVSSAVQQLLWSVHSVVSSGSKISLWNDHSVISSASQQAIWSIRPVVSSTFQQILWNLHSVTSSGSQTVLWNDHSVVSSVSQQAIWNLFSVSFLSGDIIWTAEGTISIGISGSILWNTHSIASAAHSVLWDTHELVTLTPISAIWNDRNIITNAPSAIWSTHNRLSTAKSASWMDLVTGAALTHDVTWADRAAIGDSSVITWTTIRSTTLVVLTAEAIWNTRSITQAVKDVIWSTYKGGISAEPQLIWNDRVVIIDSNNVLWTTIYSTKLIVLTAETLWDSLQVMNQRILKEARWDTLAGRNPYIETIIISAAALSSVPVSCTPLWNSASAQDLFIDVVKIPIHGW